METTISKRIRDKMDKLAQRLAELESDETIDKALMTVNESIGEVESRLEEFQGKEERGDASVLARLEIDRDRLLLQKERLELKLDIMKDRRERLQEALEMQKEAFSRTKTRPRSEIHVNSHHQPSGNPAKLYDERKRILEMLEEGKITAEEAMKLIDALQQQEEKEQAKRHRPRWVRIKVTDVKSNRIRVNLTLPVGLVRAGLRAGGNIAGMEGLDTEGLEEMLNRGEVGHILDFTDEGDGGRVEIFVE